MKTPSQYPDPQDFVSAIAQPFDGDAAQKVVAPFGIAWSDAIKLDSSLEIYTISAQPLGVAFTFKDEALVFERDYQDAGEGPFLMTHCAFWGHEAEYQPYEGPLWKNLRFSDTVADAIAKLGEPTRVGRLDIHFWELADFRLTVQWKSADQIRVVSYWMKEE